MFRESRRAHHPKYANWVGVDVDGARALEMHCMKTAQANELEVSFYERGQGVKRKLNEYPPTAAIAASVTRSPDAGTAATQRSQSCVFLP